MKAFNKKMFRIVVAYIAAIAVICSGVLSNSLLAYDDGASVSSTIAIDGLYDDWDNLPVTYIGYGGFNDDDASKGSMYTDGEYLYIKVEFADKLSYIPLSGFNLTINNNGGMSQKIMIYHDSSDLYDGKAPTEVGTYNDMRIAMVAPAKNYQVLEFTDSDIVYTVNPIDNGQVHRGFEMKMRLSDLASVFGISQEAISTISMNNPSLGGQVVSIAGSSSGPVVAVAIGSVIAIGSVYGITKKSGKKETAQEEE